MRPLHIFVPEIMFIRAAAMRVSIEQVERTDHLLIAHCLYLDWLDLDGVCLHTHPGTINSLVLAGNRPLHTARSYVFSFVLVRRPANHP